MEISSPGRLGTTLPEIDVPKSELPDSNLIRKGLNFPEVTESQLVRYFANLSQLNFSIDTNFYPLGSCTMKYNPKLHDEIASLPGFANIHPLQQEESVQGALKIMYELQVLLSEITGMDATSLAPLAGAEGELAGMLMIRKYHLSNGDVNRTKVLIPDSAHGTNPASAKMAGFEVITLKSDDQGNTDLSDLENHLNENLAAVMLTIPSTLGIFDPNIVEICKKVHDSGGMVYGDGANLNALLGKVKLGEIGVDVIHSNLHKTFSTPHGGGGPGAGPVMVNKKLERFLPSPIIIKTTDKNNEPFYKINNQENSIGKMGAFHGNFGVLLRAYVYISLLGKEGIAQISEDAVLNANYILNELKDVLDLPYNRTCMHEVVFSARNFKKKFGITALDIAKRLIDYGIHPPTMYFPLIVEEALMIEPTETETKDTLDYFIDVIKTIENEANTNPDIIHSAPHNAGNTRLDEAKAARDPDLSFKLD
tara:strand:- start:5935 stop:7371 length:1437 start_codon:yes stop_codon:yes gene_type:complete